jgi:hypothetical protein
MVEWSMPQRIAKTRCETRLAAIISWSHPPKSPSATRGGISKSPTVLTPAFWAFAPQGSGRSFCAGVTHVPCRQHAEYPGVQLDLCLPNAAHDRICMGQTASRLQNDLSDLTQLWQASGSTGTTSSALQRQGDGWTKSNGQKRTAARPAIERAKPMCTRPSILAHRRAFVLAAEDGRWREGAPSAILRHGSAGQTRTMNIEPSSQDVGRFAIPTSCFFVRGARSGT